MFSVKPDITPSGLPWQLKHHRRLFPGGLWFTILFMVAVFASGCVVHSGPHNRGPVRLSGPLVVDPHVDVRVVPAPVTFVFSNHHRHAVRDYYGHRRSHGKKHKWKSKHGRGRGRGHGPPPWARKGGHMPPGIAMQRIPRDLAGQLPPAPHGTQFIFYSDQVLLIDLRSHVVLDSISVSVGF